MIQNLIPAKTRSLFVVLLFLTTDSLCQHGRIETGGNPIDGFCTEIIWFGKPVDGFASGIRIAENTSPETKMDYPFEVTWNQYSAVLAATRSLERNRYTFNSEVVGIRVVIINQDGESAFEKDFECRTRYNYSTCSKESMNNDRWGCTILSDQDWLDILSIPGTLYYRIDGDRTRNFNTNGLREMILNSGLNP